MISTNAWNNAYSLFDSIHVEWISFAETSFNINNNFQQGKGGGFLNWKQGKRNNSTKDTNSTSTWNGKRQDSGGRASGGHRDR
jgi:hypothetical protein